MNKGLRVCVYGGQFGSEGKGCVAEWIINNYHRKSRRMIVIGENAPNSGHTSTKGKTRSLPVTAYDADVVLLGPDAAIEPNLLEQEINLIRLTHPVEVYVHENAAIITAEDILSERSGGLESRVASTVTGGGAARTGKALHRQRHLTIRQADHLTAFQVVDRVRWFELLAGYEEDDWLFECSQGLMLDLNLGYYPFVTSRTTHPRAAIERNGVGPSRDWQMVGTYRTFPIRTGGNSGPTGGRELGWGEVGVAAEVATVTKRTRRVFDFNGADFLYSLSLVRPDIIAFTHLDYLQEADRTGPASFIGWLSRKTGLPSTLGLHPAVQSLGLMTSAQPGWFQYHGNPWRPAVKSDGQPFRS